MRGYLAFQKHGLKVLTGKINRDMDRILDWCEPMKQHSLVSLQISLAYLWNLKKKAKVKAAAKRKKDKLKAKKKAEEEKKR